MLKIVESLAQKPLRFPAKPGVCYLPGYIAKIDYESMTVDICDGNRAFGIIDDVKNNAFNTTNRDLVSVWTGRMVFRTDEYEMNYPYRTGVLLFVNSDGQLTALRPKLEIFPVARVISVIKKSKQKDIIECTWF